MIPYVLPLLLTMAAGVLTYFFCVRPMRRGGSCHMSAPQASCMSTGVDAEIRRLREEVQLLCHAVDLAPERTVPLDKEEPR